MEPNVAKKSARFAEIDLLRFIAAFSVILFHYTFRGYYADHLSPVVYPGLEQVTKYGYLGVQLFFIISGYVIFMSAHDKTLKQFVVSRISRLYPAFWVACTATFLVVYLFGPAPQTLGWSSQLDVSVPQYAYNMTMLHEFLGARDLDGVYWTLSVEIGFYFLVSLVISYKLFDNIILLLFVWLCYTAKVGVDSPPTAFSLLFITASSSFFIAGILFYLLQNKMAVTWKIYSLLGFALVLSVRSEIAHAAGLTKDFHQSFSFFVTASVVVIIYFIFWLIAVRRFTIPSKKWVVVLGAVTYPIYLVHHSIGFIIFQKLGNIINKYLLLLLIIALMFCFAYLIHMLIEKKFSRRLADLVSAIMSRA